MVKQAAHINTRTLPPDTAGLAAAREALAAGTPVAIPTETVYGLAADATRAEAVARVYAAKGRPAFNPLIAHVSDADMAARHARISPLADALVARFWPGPLTLILPRLETSDIAAIVTAGLSTVALRCPDHEVPQALIADLGRPLAAPSANPSGQLSPTRAVHVARGLDGRIPLIIDGGACRRGVESTIVAVTGGTLQLLRPGAITRGELAAFADIGPPRAADIVAPGMLESHYAPGKPLRLDARSAAAGEFLIGFGEVAGDVSLSPGGDLIEAASRLFDCLHLADASTARAIAVAPVASRGIGVAINDRLRRATVPA